MKEKAISIHIGLNELDNATYNIEGRLKGCENDARFMYKLAEIKGFSPTLLISSEETTDEAGENIKKSSYKYVMKHLMEARDNLSDDGILLITFSGHGTQREDKDRNVFDYEPDILDECWMLHDGLLIDDELSFYLETFEEKKLGFKQSQRIVIISDSCHSGTMGNKLKTAFFDNTFLHPYIPVSSFNDLSNLGIDIENFRLGLSNLYDFTSHKYNLERFENDEQILKKEYNLSIENIIEENRFKLIPKKTLDDNGFFKKFGEIYNDRENEIHNFHSANLPDNLITKDLVKSSVITISACQDWQLAKDGDKHGVFTQALKDVLVEQRQIEVDEDENVELINGNEPLNYLQLHENIWKMLKNNSQLQTPNYERFGSPNAAFEMQNWLTI